MTSKIIEMRPAGWKCCVCGQKFRTEEGAFYHQMRDCSKPRQQRGRT
jgi:hypothetical protein